MTPYCFAAGEDRLQVHGLPDRASLNVFGFEGLADLLAVGAKFVGVNQEAREPACMKAPECFGHEADARQTIKSLIVVDKFESSTSDAVTLHNNLALNYL